MNGIGIIKESLEKETGVAFLGTATLEDLQTELAAYINGLIITNFEKLVFLLYRIDINENSIKLLLKQSNGYNAGEIIAKAIIERQLQKVGLRKKYTNHSDSNCGEEQW